MKQLGLNGSSLKNKGSAVRFCLWPQMKKNFLKFVLIIYLSSLIGCAAYGFYNFFFSETTLGVDYWGTLVLLIACIPSAVDVKEKL